MALYEVYIRGEHGQAIGMMVTGSKDKAKAAVDEYMRDKKEAWYEQIQ